MLIISRNSTILSDPNGFFILSIEKKINSPSHISVCGVENLYMDWEIKCRNWDSLISWIYFIYCVDDSLIVLNWPECFNTRAVLNFEDRVFDLVVYFEIIFSEHLGMAISVPVHIRKFFIYINDFIIKFIFQKWCILWRKFIYWFNCICWCCLINIVQIMFIDQNFSIVP